MKILVLIFVNSLAGYIFAEWNILVGQTYQKMRVSSKIDKQGVSFFLVRSLHFIFWPVRTTLGWPLRRRAFWEREAYFYKIFFILVGPVPKLILNLFLAFGIFSVNWTQLLFSDYVIPEIIYEEKT